MNVREKETLGYIKYLYIEKGEASRDAELVLRKPFLGCVVGTEG